MSDILKLISETERWRLWHKARGSHIEAAACSIRIKALNDAIRALKSKEGGE